MGPWHHVGATMEITLEKNWIIEVIRPGTESQNVQLNKIIDVSQKLKLFAGTSGWSVPISQSQTTVFVGQWMEWDSLPPPASWWQYQLGISFTSVQMFHTHTPVSLHEGFLSLLLEVKSPSGSYGPKKEKKSGAWI